MASSALVLVAWKTLFSLLTGVMAVALVYGFYEDYFFSCFDPRARWMQAGLLDFGINVSFITAWYFYKESRWIMRVLFIFLLFWLGSFAICGYILIQLFKLSPEESSKDPLYFVLAKRPKRDVTRQPSVVTTRVIYIGLAFLMLGMSIFTFIVDGSPFRSEVLSACMIALLTDLCIHVVVFGVWVAYKESSWINTIFWILIIACFGSIGICAYVVRELFYLSPEQPIFLVLFNKNNRDMILGDPLMGHADV